MGSDSVPSALPGSDSIVQPTGDRDIIIIDSLGQNEAYVCTALVSKQREIISARRTSQEHDIEREIISARKSHTNTTTKGVN